MRRFLLALLAALMFTVALPFAAAQAAGGYYVLNRSSFGVYVSVNPQAPYTGFLAAGAAGSDIYAIKAPVGFEVTYRSRVSGNLYVTGCGVWEYIGNPVDVLSRSAADCV